MINRVILIVLDSVGVGALPDADKFGDAGSDTLGHIFGAMDKNFTLTNLASFGLYNILSSLNLKKPKKIIGSYGKMASISPGKDTTLGHWELSGVVSQKPLPTYLKGFPKDLIEKFEQKIGTKILGNVTASGTKIIEELGEKHCTTGYPIVYTSADSVFQIAAHEKTFGLGKLYDICKIAREMLAGNHAVGRVIARPFIGFSGKFVRTQNRKDYSLSPIDTTVLDRIKDSGGSVVAVGKIKDIFNNRGITEHIEAHTNAEGMKVIEGLLERKPDNKTLVFSNLVDFDMLWGHRRDVKSYAEGLKNFDKFLPVITEKLKDNDLLIITADHGCDPTFSSHTDHTREYVPLLVYGKKAKSNVNLGIRKTFADVAQTICDIFDLEDMKYGTSFKKQLEI
ncbi:phosphopentomutase [Elusimicrobiota bacterium]